MQVEKKSTSIPNYPAEIFRTIFNRDDAMHTIQSIIDQEILPNGAEIKTRSDAEGDDAKFSPQEIFLILLANEMLKMGMKNSYVSSILAFPDILVCAQDLEALKQEKALLFYGSVSPEYEDFDMSSGPLNFFIFYPNSQREINQLFKNHFAFYSINLSELAEHIIMNALFY